MALPYRAVLDAERFEAVRIGRGVHHGGAAAIPCVVSRAPEHIEKMMQVHPKRAAEGEKRLAGGCLGGGGGRLGGCRTGGYQQNPPAKRAVHSWKETGGSG